MDDWRPQIEARASAALGAPLRIGAIRVRSGGWVPALELDDVRLLDDRGQVALALGRVSAALSPATLWALAPRFAQLHLDGVRLDVRRDAAGRLHVAGLDMGGGTAGGDSRALDWFLEQHEFVIRRGTLRWTDEQRGAPPLALTDVDLVLRNGARSHRLRIDATPPADWGDRFTLRGEFRQPITARASAWQRWRGVLYAELPRVDVSQLRRHVTLPFELDQGRGALRGWFEIDGGRTARATTDLALNAVSVRLSRTLPPLALAQLHGRLEAATRPQGVELAIERLSFVTDDGVPWAPSTLRLALQRDPKGGADAPWTGGTLQVDQLSLGPLERLAARMPLPPALHRQLSDLAPQGELRALSLDWSGPPEAPQRYRLQARAEGLALLPGPPGPPAWGLPQTAGRPGLSGARIALQATERGGEATLTLRDGALVFPGVFEQPAIALQSLDATLAWRIDPGAGGAPPAVQVEVRDARFANADAAGRLTGRWHTGRGTEFAAGGRFPGVIEIKGTLERGDTAAVARYLPLGVPASARGYVARAVGPGRVKGAEFEAQGDLWHFPFAEGQPGRFRVRAQVEGLRYAFIPSEPGWSSPWPALTEVSGTLSFDRAALRFENAAAMLEGVALRGVKGGIADLVRQPVLRLDGQARGSGADLLRFVNATPVGGWIGGALAQASVGGNADLALALTLPIETPERTGVRGSLQLAGNDVRLRTGTPLLGQARARIEFTERSLTVAGGRARVLGGDATFEGGTQADGTLRFTGQGQATAEGLLRAGELPALAALAPAAGAEPRLRGSAAYRVQLGFPQGRPELLVTSPLAGLALDLPPPLAKPAAAAWPLRVQIQPQADRIDTDQLRVDLGDALRVRLERDVSGDEARVRRGSLALGAEAPPLPAAGVVALARLPRLDLTPWQALLAGTGSGGGGSASSGIGVTAPDWLPTQATLLTPELVFEGRRLSGVALELKRQAAIADTLWQADLRADQAEGWIEWRQPREAGAPGRLAAHLARLQVPAADAGAVAEWVEKAPQSAPALQLVIDDLNWRGRALGRLEVVAENRSERAGLREWQLDRLRLSVPEATLDASGRWSPGQRSDFRFELALADGGRFFERLGAGRAMQGGKGRMGGTLSWPGSPLSPDLAKAQGKLEVALGEGRFLDAEPGVARLSGILSLQALPRRLLLDFRDVFQQGLSFDRIEGDIALADGIARTGNLRVLGVQAAVLVEGSADLQRETQDLRIVAVPELNTGTASLAWAALNPALGLGAFVAQLLLNKPMTAAATREFHVTGPWADPKVERVQRVSAASAAASAPRTP